MLIYLIIINQCIDLLKLSQESGSQLFSTWNNLESFDEDTIGSSKVKTSQSLYLDDEEDDIPIIPDIEELRDQDFIQQTAEAPNIEINRLDNIEELDKKVRKTPFLSTSDNIDLSILANLCLPEDKVRENDITWTWDSLITDVMYNADMTALTHIEQDSKTNE